MLKILTLTVKWRRSAYRFGRRAAKTEMPLCSSSPASGLSSIFTGLWWPAAPLFCCSFCCPLYQECETLQTVQVIPQSYDITTESNFQDVLQL